MSNNVFVDKSTGEQVTILETEDNFYVLDNSVRIKKDIFDKKYTQKAEVDPNAFFQAPPSADPLVAMAEQLKNVDTSKIKDNPSTGAQVKFIEKPIVLSDNSLPGDTIKQSQVEGEIPLSPEDKRAMLEEWRRTQPGAQIPEIQNKDYDDERFLNGDKPITVEPKIDPIEMMFKMFKNNYPVKLNIEMVDNIPNPTFIGMIQENVETDAVEYYANLISDKYLKDPEKLKKEVYKQLKSIINKELGIEDEEKNEEKNEEQNEKTD